MMIALKKMEHQKITQQILINIIIKAKTEKNFLKNKTADQISKALESGELDEILQKQLPLSKGRATADYYALNMFLPPVAFRQQAYTI